MKLSYRTNQLAPVAAKDTPLQTGSSSGGAAPRGFRPRTERLELSNRIQRSNKCHAWQQERTEAIREKCLAVRVVVVVVVVVEDVVYGRFEFVTPTASTLRQHHRAMTSMRRGHCAIAATPTLHQREPRLLWLLELYELLEWYGALYEARSPP